MSSPFPPSSSALPPSPAEIDSLLARIRENPQDLGTLQDLTGKGLDFFTHGHGKERHWFCDSINFELATCLLRLFAFKSKGKVLEWRQLLEASYGTCIRCQKAFAKGKRKLQEKYLSCFNESTVRDFLNHVSNWETEQVIRRLREHGLREENEVVPADEPPFTELSRLPPELLYTALSQPAFFASEVFERLLRGGVTSSKCRNLKEAPPGFFVLLLHRDPTLREWGAAQVGHLPEVSEQDFSPALEGVVYDAMQLLASAYQQNVSRPFVPPPYLITNRPTFAWKGFRQILSLLSPSIILRRLVETSEVSGGATQLVCGHLHDRDEHFPEVLGCFAVLLRKIGDEVWKGEEDLWPQTIVDSVFDNPALEQLLVNDCGGRVVKGQESEKDGAVSTTASERLAWAGDYLRSVASSARFPEFLAKVANFFFDRFQHTRFSLSTRATILGVGVRMLKDLFDRYGRDSEGGRARALTDVFDMYASILATAAFDRSYQTAGLLPVRLLALELLAKVFNRDVDAIAEAVLTLSDVSPKRLRSATADISSNKGVEALPTIFVARELWTKSYAKVADSDLEGNAMLTSAVAKISYLSSPLYTERFIAPEVGNERSTRDLRNYVQSINKAFAATRDDFGTIVLMFAEGSPEQLMNFLGRPDMAEALTVLTLSPDKTLHNAAMAIVRNAFPDAADRQDCFRFLLQNNPEASFQGLIRFVQAFTSVSTRLVEAVDLAKWLVRCFRDIIEVLCAPSDGLLSSGSSATLVSSSTAASFTRRIPRLWSLMCSAIALIFKQTPLWAEYFDNEAMTDWMRDALLFADQLIEQFRVFEAAAMRRGYANTTNDGGEPSSQSPAKLTNTGMKMIRDLDEPLQTLPNWLRLNDQDLLSMTLNLLCKILRRFHRSRIEPSPANKTKLQDVVRKQRKRWARRRDAANRGEPLPNDWLLTETQISELSYAIDPSSKVIVVSDDEGPAPSSSQPSSTKKSLKMRQQTIMHSFALATMKRSSSEAAGEHNENRKDHSSVSLPIGATRKSSHTVTPSLQAQAARGTLGIKSSTPAAASLNKYRPPSASSSTASKLKSSSVGKGLVSELRKQHREERGRVAPAVPFGARRPVMTAAEAGSALDAKAAQRQQQQGKEESGESESDSSEESSGEEEGQAKGGLGALIEHQKSSVKSTAIFPGVLAPRRQVQMIDDGAERRQLAREEAERKRRLRAAPEFSSLHRDILQWDFNHDGDLPPSAASQQYPKVPERFDDANAYADIFGPLLMLEAWAQLRQAKEGMHNEQVVPIEVAGRSAVDDFVEIAALIKQGQMQSVGFTDSDIVCLRQPPSGPDQSWRQVLAKVEAFHRRPQQFEITLKTSLAIDKQGVSQGLVPKSRWEIIKLFSLNTLHREYAALMALPYYDLLRDVLRGHAVKGQASPDEVRKAMTTYQVNEPQASAIVGSLAADGFSLIQGPPGTGKTKTICGLVGAFMSDRPRPATYIRPGQAARQQDKAPSKKVLLCAPSNAAIDEVAKRLKAGVRTANGQLQIPNVVRIGNDASINISVKDISIDELVDQRLTGTSAGSSSGGTVDLGALRAEINDLRRQRDAKQIELSNVQSNAALKLALEAELKKINATRYSKMQKLDEERDKQKDANRAQEALRRKFRMEVLTEADVICSTLSGAGHDYINTLPFDFETVIIDEAAQSIELSSLIPLKYGCKRCILVGDPNQLPPTVISMAADKYGYSKSLFVRMFEQNPQAVHLLNIQYRMHPDISVFPSATFYDSKLQDGPGMDAITRQPWHNSSLFKPFVFFNISGFEQQARGHSLKNSTEATHALALYDRLRQDFSGVDFDYRIGVVSMYKEQVWELKQTFRRRYGDDIVGRIDFNTVDGFQGQEKDIIILSCVRGTPGPFQGVGFLADRRRANVALTRAKSSLFVLGNATTLQHDQLWGKVVSNARERGAIVDANISTFRDRRAPVVPSKKDACTPIQWSHGKVNSVNSADSMPNSHAKKTAAKQSPQSKPNASPSQLAKSAVTPAEIVAVKTKGAAPSPDERPIAQIPPGQLPNVNHQKSNEEKGKRRAEEDGGSGNKKRQKSDSHQLPNSVASGEPANANRNAGASWSASHRFSERRGGGPPNGHNRAAGSGGQGPQGRGGHRGGGPGRPLPAAGPVERAPPVVMRATPKDANGKTTKSAGEYRPPPGGPQMVAPRATGLTGQQYGRQNGVPPPPSHLQQQRPLESRNHPSGATVPAKRATNSAFIPKKKRGGRPP